VEQESISYSVATDLTTTHYWRLEYL